MSSSSEDRQGGQEEGQWKQHTQKDSLMTRTHVGDTGMHVGDVGVHAGGAGMHVGHKDMCLGCGEVCWGCEDTSQGGGP